MTRKAIYGTVAYFGGWSVSFEPEGVSENITLSGYDREFPRDRFPHIPVVDFRTCEDFKRLPNAYVAECFAKPSRFRKDLPLTDMLQLYKSAGCTVTA